MNFEQFLAEQNLSTMAQRHFNSAARHPEGSLHWHKNNARAHAVLSQHFDKVGDRKKAAEHHSKSEAHITAAEKIEDKQDGF